MPSTSVCSGNGIGVAQMSPNVPKFVKVAVSYTHLTLPTIYSV